MVLGLFLAAFGSLIADASHLVRPDVATHTDAIGSDMAHPTKREPSRIVVVDIRRDSAPASASADGGSFLPPPARWSFPADAPGTYRFVVPGGTAGTGASPFQPRAPPAAA
ncbi:protein of unknown function [Pseudorhizobium banfieldiae]|uniref:Uncharacterized protein n=1 Tax=Pseudorhizobium banfieldiae TaxID=1125847 RepID=L0NJV2_9HYPH|nr:hypothetical protein [Pseudorhizobium banfieldiae]CCF21355.1 protein of unknown function [Pseudorhizobium banfieldiae]